ncbi:hypothetical protein IAU60_005775 [Kwoniella sp. DSM 27419]
MQYLSKAYSYSIDVIVVRHVDTEGNVTLSSSPFHVRFGKLQVLRAAEKRVTIRLPNNLPAPHVAPFGMKVGEAGEAFFVVETNEQVPEDLLTSPVVMPTEAEIPPPDPSGDDSSDDESGDNPLVTQEPFGKTEKQQRHADPPLDEVDFLDLNADNNDGSQSTAASSDQPSASSSSEALRRKPSTSENNSGEPPNDEAKAKKESEQVLSTTSRNPMEAQPGEGARRAPPDDKLTKREGRSGSEAEDMLPKVKHGEGRGPPVLYGGDVVIDMAGYHSGTPNPASPPPEDPDPAMEAFIHDLLEAGQPFDDSRPRLSERLTDPNLSSAPDPDDTPIPSPASELVSEPDLAAALANVHLTPKSISRRFDRGHSEPPQDTHSAEMSSPTRAVHDTLEWNKRGPHRSNSGPLPSAPSSPSASRTQLKNVEENPYDFVLDTADSSHRFQLALCEQVRPSVEVSLTLQGNVEKFGQNRVTFQRFIEDLSIVEDPRLVIKYNDRSSSGYGWSKWWRRGPSDVEAGPTPPEPIAPRQLPTAPIEPPEGKQYAKTLRLSSDQLSGPNTIQFSVTSSYSGIATCSSRVFLWEETDQIVISDIDGTITKEVVMRKPEVFKMACLKDIQRLFGSKYRDAFYAGFGNRSTDAVSYMSVGIEPAKIYTIDPTGVVLTELLQDAGHKGSYIELVSAISLTFADTQNNLVNETFPPVSTKVKPEFSDFNYWRDSIPDIPLPDLSPPSPALSARSDGSGRLSSLRNKITSLGRRSSTSTLLPTSEPSSRPSSPLIAPAMTPDDLSEVEEDDDGKSQISMPGSFDGNDPDQLDRDEFVHSSSRLDDVEAQLHDDSFNDDDSQFDDDILAAGEMQHVPF